MTLYNPRSREITYSVHPDLYFTLEDEYMELLDVLAQNKLDGHDRYTQWMMKMEIKMKELLDTIGELDEEAPTVMELPELL